MQAVEKAVASLARESRRDLWPRFTARKAGVSTSEAREAMLDLVRSGLLDLWYVVLSDSGDEVGRYKHPEKAPVGQQVTNFRAEEPETFTVEPDDVYLMFSPTERLDHLVGVGGEDDPKAQGAEARVSAPSPASPTPDERADRSPRWDPDNLTINLINVAGDYIGGDKIGRDKIENVGAGTVYKGDQGTVASGPGSIASSTAAPGAKKNKTVAGIIIAFGILLALALIALFIRLGHVGTLSWPVAIGCAALSSGASIGITNMVASHIRH